MPTETWKVNAISMVNRVSIPDEAFTAAVVMIIAGISSLLGVPFSARGVSSLMKYRLQVKVYIEFVCLFCMRIESLRRVGHGYGVAE